MFGWLRELFASKKIDEKPADLSVDDLRKRVERLCREAGLPGADEAYRRLDAGDLDGTILEVELKVLRFHEDRSKDWKERELVP